MKASEEVMLPVTSAINDVITSSLFNFAYADSDEELISKISSYIKKFNGMLLNLLLTITFETLVNGRYEKKYSLKFELKAIDFSVGIIVGLSIEE